MVDGYMLLPSGMLKMTVQLAGQLHLCPIMWFRYKHKWASGINTSWEYVEWSDSYEKTKKGEHSFIDDMDLCKNHNWSNKYRGIDYDLIECPPKEWLEKRIARLEQSIVYTAKTIKRFRKLLK